MGQHDAAPGGLDDPMTQRDTIDMAFATDDPRRVSQAIKAVAARVRLPCRLDDDPKLGDVMRVLRDLGLGFVVHRLTP